MDVETTCLVVQIGPERLSNNSRWPVHPGEAHVLLMGKTLNDTGVIQVQLWGDAAPIQLQYKCHTTMSPQVLDGKFLVTDDTVVLVKTWLEKSAPSLFVQSMRKLPSAEKFIALISLYSRLLVTSPCTRVLVDILKLSLNRPCFSLRSEDVLFSSQTSTDRLLEDIFEAAWLTNGLVLVESSQDWLVSQPELLLENWPFACAFISLLHRFPSVPVVVLIDDIEPPTFLVDELKISGRFYHEKNYFESLVRSELESLLRDLVLETDELQPLLLECISISILELEKMFSFRPSTVNLTERQIYPKELLLRIRSLKHKKSSGIGKLGDMPYSIKSFTDGTANVQINWSDFCPNVIGQEMAKRRLYECLVLPLMHQSEMMKLGLENPIRGIILFGPPGGGKTLLVTEACRHAKYNLLSVSAADLVRGDVGESEIRVSRLFRNARSCSPCVLFLDEADGMLAVRSDAGPHAKKIVSQFVLEMDALIEHAGRIVLIAATNTIERIDTMFLRQGRFERKARVGEIADRESLKQIFALVSASDQRLNNISWSAFVDSTVIPRLNGRGLTGAQVGQIILRALVESERGASCASVTEADLILALDQQIRM